MMWCSLTNRIALSPGEQDNPGRKISRSWSKLYPQEVFIVLTCVLGLQVRQEVPSGIQKGRSEAGQGRDSEGLSKGVIPR